MSKAMDGILLNLVPYVTLQQVSEVGPTTVTDLNDLICLTALRHTFYNDKFL